NRALERATTVGTTREPSSHSSASPGSLAAGRADQSRVGASAGSLNLALPRALGVWRDGRLGTAWGQICPRSRLSGGGRRTAYRGWGGGRPAARRHRRRVITQSTHTASGNAGSLGHVPRPDHPFFPRSAIPGRHRWAGLSYAGGRPLP